MVQPIFEFIELKNKKVPVNIYKQKKKMRDVGVPMHWHEAIEFYFVLEGGVRLLCNGHLEWLKKGDTGFVNWCEVHRGMEFIDDTVFLTIQIDVSSLESNILNDNSDPLFGTYKRIPTFIRDNDKLITLAKSMYEIMSSYNTESEDNQNIKAASTFKLKSIIYDLLYQIISITKEDSWNSQEKFPHALTLIKKALSIIAYNYMNPLSLESISHELGVTKPHLSRMFKRYTNQTLHQYINDYRCHQALNLIRSGVSLTDAAYKVGYENYNYFSRVFKQVFGESPKKYTNSNSH